MDEGALRMAAMKAVKLELGVEACVHEFTQKPCSQSLVPCPPGSISAYYEPRRLSLKPSSLPACVSYPSRAARCAASPRAAAALHA